MHINYTVVALVAILVIVLIFFLIRRNRKDEKTFEKEMNESEIKPEKHQEGSV